jgi:opacity protein-like surface antigen
MSLKLVSRLFLVAVLISATSSAFSQTTYDASEGRLPLSVGGGISNFDPYFAQGPAPNNSDRDGLGLGRMWGGTVWADVGIRYGAPWMHAFSVEGQYRSIFAGDNTGQQDLKESTIGGGLTYTVRRWHLIHPYGKVLFGDGSIKFAPEVEPSGAIYSQDSRGLLSLGGGLEVRCTSHIWARADYEYQSWGQLLAARNLQPQGITVGAMYHFTRSGR